MSFNIIGEVIFDTDSEDVHVGYAGWLDVGLVLEVPELGIGETEVFDKESFGKFAQKVYDAVEKELRENGKPMSTHRSLIRPIGGYIPKRQLEEMKGK